MSNVLAHGMTLALCMTLEMGQMVCPAATITTYLIGQKPVLHQGWYETNALYHQFGPINLWSALEAFMIRAV